MTNLEEKQAKYNELIGRILANKESVSKGLYDIGLDLNSIKDRELYLLEWRSFDEFLEKRVEISKRTAFRCMKIASEFKRTEFKIWGLKKLDIIQAQLPEPQDRKDFMKIATGGEKTKKLKEDITKFIQEKGIKRLAKQIGTFPKHSTDPNEHILKLQREAAKLEEQYKQIQALKATFKESCLSWIKAAEKYPNLADLRHRIEVLKEI